MQPGCSGHVLVALLIFLLLLLLLAAFLILGEVLVLFLGCGREHERGYEREVTIKLGIGGLHINIPKLHVYFSDPL